MRIKQAMRRAIPLLLVLLLDSPARSETLIGKGRVIAETFCSGCHAIGLRGKSPNPKSPPFRTLGKKYPLSNLEEALGEGIVVGHEGSEMPPFVFSSRQVEALMAYLASVQKQ